MFRLCGSGVRGAQLRLPFRRRGWASSGKTIPLSAEKYNVKRGQFAEVRRGRNTDGYFLAYTARPFPLLDRKEERVWLRETRWLQAA